ncbi:MAG: peptide-methionine (R)-S-oxide reductase MsrB [Sphingomicrobium sp.]
MIDRRGLLGGAGLALAGLAALRWPTAAASFAQAKFAVTRTPAEWRRLLGPERFAILRQAGTERAYSSPLDKEKRKGVFICAGCAQPLFASAAKFDSGTGWPSFWKALPRAVVSRPDRSLLIERTEVLCSRCGGHLGHLFDDGPKPTGLRYCMNGLALRFRSAKPVN